MTSRNYRTAANSPSGTIADTDTFTFDRSGRMLSAVSGRYTSLGDLSYTWDANKNKTSESITGVMSGYGFTSGGTTYDFEDRLTGSAPAERSTSPGI